MNCACYTTVAVTNTNFRSLKKLISAIYASLRKWLKLLMVLFFGVVLFGVLFYFRLSSVGSMLFSRITGYDQRAQKLLVMVLKLTDIPYLLISSVVPVSLIQHTLVIDEADYAWLNANLPAEGLLTDEYKQYVNASLITDGQSFPVRVRYRGDKPNHWINDKKSWRLKFEDSSPLGEVKVINFILPEDRGFFEEALSFFVAERLNLFNLKNDFVELSVNGKHMGVYFLVEHWSREAIGRNGLDPNTNVYGEANTAVGFPDDLYSSADNFDKYLSISELPEDDKSRLEAFLEVLNNPDDEVFFEQLPSVLNVGQFIRWQAHAQLFFTYNYGSTHDAKLLLNRETNTMEFLPWNIAMSDPNDKSIYDFEYNPVMDRVFDNPRYLCQRDQVLFGYVSDQRNISEMIDYLNELHRRTRWAFFRDRLKLVPNPELGIRVNTITKNMKKSHEKILQQTSERVRQCIEEGLL